MIRTHPAIVAQAAATCGGDAAGTVLPRGRHRREPERAVLGDRWPAPDERLEMLEEAIEVIRLLWQGGEQTHRGKHYTVDNARLYTLPEEPVPIAVAAAKPKAAELAGRDRRRARQHRRRTRRSSTAYRDAGGEDRGTDRCAVLGGERGRGEGDGVPALAAHRPWRDDQPGAAAPVRLRRCRGERDQGDGDG